MSGAGNRLADLRHELVLTQLRPLDYMSRFLKRACNLRVLSMPSVREEAQRERGFKR